MKTTRIARLLSTAVLGLLGGATLTLAACNKAADAGTRQEANGCNGPNGCGKTDQAGKQEANACSGVNGCKGADGTHRKS